MQLSIYECDGACNIYRNKYVCCTDEYKPWKWLVRHIMQQKYGRAGYCEDKYPQQKLVAEKIDGDKEKCILRFNIDAFRNNYGISDIVKMNLKYYAIKVGESTEASLNIEEEFKADYEDSTITSLTDNVDEVEDKELLTVYDVVLAGVV